MRSLGGRQSRDGSGETTSSNTKKDLVDVTHIKGKFVDVRDINKVKLFNIAAALVGTDGGNNIRRSLMS